MIVRRRTWLYRLAGQRFVQAISFTQPLTTAQARTMIRRAAGNPVELWGRGARVDETPQLALGAMGALGLGAA